MADLTRNIAMVKQGFKESKQITWLFSLSWSKEFQPRNPAWRPNFTMLMFSDKIINSRAHHASLSSGITSKHALSLVPSKISRESYIKLTFTFHSTIENFSACCNTWRGIKLTASQTLRLRSACSLAITNMSREVSMRMFLAERKDVLMEPK